MGKERRRRIVGWKKKNDDSRKHSLKLTSTVHVVCILSSRCMSLQRALLVVPSNQNGQNYFQVPFLRLPENKYHS